VLLDDNFSELGEVTLD